MELLKEIFTSSAYRDLIPVALALVLLLALLAKSGIFSFHNGLFSIGNGGNEKYLMKRRQEWVFGYIMGLEKEFEYADDGERFFAIAILERVYDKFVEMIIYDDISSSSEYVKNKQALIRSVVYSFRVKEEYKTEEFSSKIDRWVEEAIEGLVVIKQLSRKELK